MRDALIAAELPPDTTTLPDPGLPEPGWLFVAFGVLFVCAVLYMVVVTVYRYRAARRRGINPLTMDSDLAARLMESEVLRAAAPADAGPTPAGAPSGTAGRSVEDRLRELDDLHERGVISAEERAAARATVLGS